MGLPQDPHLLGAVVRLHPAVLVSPFYSNYRNYLGHVFIFLLPSSLPTKQTPRKHVFACPLPDGNEAWHLLGTQQTPADRLTSARHRAETFLCFIPLSPFYR